MNRSGLPDACSCPRLQPALRGRNRQLAQVVIGDRLNCLADKRLDQQCLRFLFGQTTGALDDSLLFYLRARGLSEKEAQALLIQAFVGEAIESIVNDGLRELAIATAQRWLEARA